MLNQPVKNQGKLVDAIACDKCKCTWLYPVRANRYSTLQQPLTMQPTTIHFDSDFNLLICCGCGNTVFPPVEAYQTATLAHSLYMEMVEEVSGSKEKAEERLRGASVQKKAKGTWDHIPDKREEQD